MASSEPTPQTPYCVTFDRDGSQAPEVEGSQSFLPWNSLCVPACEATKDCPDGFQCDGRYDEMVSFTENGLAMQRLVSHRVCAPVARYGSGTLGSTCAKDEDCGHPAPFCVMEKCAMRCPDCPAGFTCTTVEMRLRAFRRTGFCLPE